MKKLLFLVLIGVVGYGGYTYYTSNGQAKMPSQISSRLPVIAPREESSEIVHVLGTTTSNFIEKGTDILNNVTGGHAEPIINKAVSDLQDRIKELPEQEYKKVKYEFCKDVFPSPGVQN